MFVKVGVIINDKVNVSWLKKVQQRYGSDLKVCNQNRMSSFFQERVSCKNWMNGVRLYVFSIKSTFKSSFKWFSPYIYAQF